MINLSNTYKSTIREIINRQNAQSLVAQQVLGYIETLMNEVSIDQDMLVQKLEEILYAKDINDKNILRRVVDSVFGIFGLNIISDNERQRVGKVSLMQEEKMLCVDGSHVDNIISAIVNVVDDSEKEKTAFGDKAAQFEKFLCTANRDTEKIRLERDELQKELIQKDKETLRSLQRILAQHPALTSGKENEKDAFVHYLEELGITWSWDDTSSSDDFMTYIITDPDFVGVKQPCLYREGKVVLKGLKYSMGE